MNKNDLIQHIKKILVHDFAFEVLLNKTNPSHNTCCGIQHKIIPFNSTNKIKCLHCAKYVLGTKFSTHLKKCISKKQPNEKK